MFIFKVIISLDEAHPSLMLKKVVNFAGFPGKQHYTA